MSEKSRSSSDDTSRFVTVFHQLKETESVEEGDRFVIHGHHIEDRHKYDEEDGEFYPIARPIAIVDAGVEMDEDDVNDWCNSHAGKAVLEQYFPELEPDDPTLPDMEEYTEGPA